MQRLFVALVPPAEVVQRLSDLQWGVPRARWCAPDQLHMTLRFIGDVRLDEAARVEEALMRLDAPAFRLSLGGVGHFPPRGRARVLWAGARKSEAVVALKGQIDGLLADVGLRRERRRFTPHVTLARLGNVPQSKVGEWLVGRGLFRTPDFEVGELYLMHSRQHRAGADYETVCRVPLRRIGGEFDAERP